MPRLKQVTPENAHGEVKEIYDAVKSRFGMIPNLFIGFASNPAVLKSYLALDELISGGVLTPVEREIVRLTVSQINDCEYCLAAHTAVGKMSGLSEEQMLSARRGKAEDPKHAALVNFTHKVMETKGFVGDGDIEAFRAAGFSDEHIGEVVAIIAQKTLSNLFNHINETEVDFPQAPKI